jgi:glycosyltransferase involved in cell wall biosynthesis
VAWEAGGAQRDPELQYLGALSIAAAQLGLAHRLRFLGERTDIRSLYGAADIYCQPNVTPESYGLTFIEALYAGLPVVTSGIGGAVEIVDATCGVLVPPRDPRALADALQRLIEAPAERRALGAAGPARARALSDPAARVAELANQLATWMRR